MEAVERWLKDHARSAHTLRKYEACAQRFLEWCLLMGHDPCDVNTADIQDYLEEVHRGRNNVGLGNAVSLAGATVRGTLSILRSLFDALVRFGMRADNPARGAAWASTESQVAYRREVWADVGWLEAREQLIARTWAAGIERDPLWRAIAVAELATWAGLRRSELSSALMSDFRQQDGQWRVRLPRFGRGEVSEIEVPLAAMESLSGYRVSRGLTPFPLRSELRVPLIAALRSERPVNSWTVAQTLGLLSSNAMPAQPNILQMRRAMAAAAAQANLKADELARHFRSESLFDRSVTVTDRWRCETSIALDRIARTGKTAVS